MTFTEHDYECVARYLDGEAINLTEVQQVLLADLQADESATIHAPARQVPAQAQIRARHRLHQASGMRAAHHRLRTAGALLAGAAAAAIIMVVAIAAALRSNPTPEMPDSSFVISDVDPDVHSDPDPELLAMQNELQALENELFETEALLTLLDDEPSAEDRISDALLQSDVEAMLEYFN